MFTVLPKKDKLLVGLQALLFILFLLPFTWYVFEVGYNVMLFCYLAKVVGFLIIIISIFQLRKQLSPFPSPREKGKLITSGIFKYIRHPIYSGILMLFFGSAIYQGSFYKVLISVLLLILFYYKSNYEEQLLANYFKEYGAYQKTTGRFLPKIEFLQR
ncbi:DUF1295 domain-containing protein [Aquimarina sp. ERC-38]|uniref:methyltransferase family protein n=1 Tax=Aquimarina sp. ERC-38 TaxID=2949996 RepID=UPI0022476E2F|nr:methyltransferase [Aquimarina sp. ERC-38]UZO80392.1 DUF1295 domain-containing protein [Aquimarina sp. ERC-38]